MTQLEKLTSLYDEFGIEYDIDVCTLNKVVVIAESANGYSYTQFNFDAGGKFTHYDIFDA